MPGHDTSSFVSRNRDVAGVTRWKKFCAAERFQEVPADSRPHLRLAASLPDFTRTELRSPRITTPMRRLTVDRKPLRTHGSLAQPPMPGNGLYATESPPVPRLRCSDVGHSSKDVPNRVSARNSSLVYSIDC